MLMVQISGEAVEVGGLSHYLQGSFIHIFLVVVSGFLNYDNDLSRGVVRESPQNPLNSGLGITVYPMTDPWEERYIYPYIYHKNQLQ